MTTFLRLASAAIVLAHSLSAQATLLDRGRGLVYDTDTNLTWLKDWNYSKTSGYDADGFMNWNQSITWAAQLVYSGYDDWRLPQNETVNEMAHIWFNELGNIVNQPRINSGPFIIPNEDYWIGSLNFPSAAFTFTQTGTTSTGNITQFHLATAVRVGDVPAVPETSTLAMLGAGLAVLAICKNVKDRRRHIAG